MKNIFDNKTPVLYIQGALLTLLLLVLIASVFFPLFLIFALLILLFIIALFIKTSRLFFSSADRESVPADKTINQTNPDSGMNNQKNENRFRKVSDTSLSDSDDDEPEEIQPVNTAAANDHARVVDDTQASILFNKTADSIIDLIHQTLNAHSTFFYLYNYQGPELILQCYRSHNQDFTRRSALSMHDPDQHPNMRYFHDISLTRELKVIPITESESLLPYYSQPVSVRSLMMAPLLRRGTLLGILGVDHTEPAAFGDFHIQIMHKYVGLLRHSIHSIDAVFIKNRLTRMSSAIKDYSEFIRNADSENVIFFKIRPTISSVITYDRYSLWMFNHKNQTLILVDQDSKQNKQIIGATSHRHTLERFVIQTRQTLFIPSAPDHVFPHGLDRDRIADQYLTSVLCVPVIDQDHCFGVLTIEIDDKNAFDVHQMQFTESMCHIAGLATSRVYLDQSLDSELSSDPLTGIDNQVSFLKKLNAEIYRAKRFNTAFSLLILEIDNLERITEQYGNRYRHFILEKVAQVIRQSLRQVDIAARLDNDHLAIILIESPLVQTQDCAFRIKKQIQMTPFEIDDILIPVRTSSGVSQFGVHGSTPEDLLRSAALTMENSKPETNS